jgi:CelD/BcsL family acetyltransferase involved in cellulose biosynthesis
MAQALAAEPPAQPSTVTIEWVTSPAEIASLADEWRALEAAVQNRTVLSSFDFLTTWYGHYAGEYGGTPLVGIARRGSALVGIAPLTLRRGSLARVPVTRVDFAPNDSPVGAFLVEDDRPDTVTALLDSLVRNHKFDLACFNGFDPESQHLAALRAAADRHRLAMKLEDHAYALADVSGGYEKYRTGLSGHFRRNLNTKARKIESAGGRVEGVVLNEGVENRDAFLARMIAVTEASYKLQGRRLRDDHRAYLSELVARFGPRGMLSLTVLSIGGEDAAYLFGLVERGCFYDINLAYAEIFAKLSPGGYLMQKTTERLAAAGVHTVISHGAHEYKKHWATRFVDQKRAYVFTHGLRSTAARFIRFSLSTPRKES